MSAVLDKPLLTYAQIQGRLQEIEADLRDRQDEYEASAADMHRLAREYEYRYARALMVATADTVAERKAQATIAIASAEDSIWDELKTAEARYESLRAAITVLEQRATIGMSLLKTYSREIGGNF